MYSHFNKKRWHSIWCHLCVGGRHCWDLCQAGTHSSHGCCSTILWLSQSFCFDWQMICNVQHNGAIKAMVLHEEAFVVRASAPSKMHVRAYMTAVHGKPSRTHPTFTLREEGEPYLPTSNPHLGGETLHHLQVDLGDLADHELCQLMEDLCQEVTLHELNAPPQKPSTNTFGKCSREQGSQCKWPGGHLS